MSQSHKMCKDASKTTEYVGMKASFFVHAPINVEASNLILTYVTVPINHCFVH